MIDLLIKLLPYIAPAIRYADNPARSYWNVPLLIYTVIVAALDVIVAHLFFAPTKYEWTVSHVLERWIFDSEKSADAIRLATAINKISKDHIQGLSRALNEATP